MKRTRIINVAVVLTIGISLLRSQAAYYDAMMLRRFYTYDTLSRTWGSNNDSIIAVYKNYTAGLTKEDQIKSAYNANPFFKDLKYYGRPHAFGVLPSIASSTLSSVSGLDVTNVADGMAKFLVARTKQELAAAFFDRFKAAISDTNYRDFQKLFPTTFITLSTIGDDIYNFDAYTQTLRESFEKDLASLLEHIPEVVDVHSEMRNDFKAILKSACYIAEGLRDRQHPGDILKDFPTSYLDSLKSWKGAIQTLQLISASLRDTTQLTDSTSYWVSPRQVEKLLDDPITFKIYLGLLYQQACNEKIAFEGMSLRQALDSIYVHFDLYYTNYRGYFTNLANSTAKLTRLLNSYRKTTNDTAALAQYHNYVNASIDLLESASDIGKLIPQSELKLTSDVFWKNVRGSFSQFFDVARSATNIVWDIKRRSYASAIINLAHIYDRVVATPAASSVDSLTRQAKVENDCSKKKVLEIQIGRLTKQKESLGRIVRYGTFMATIVQAKNSDEVEQAIEAIALPAGSSRIKRESPFNVSLNSYVGAFMGREIVDKANNNPYINSYGATAVIGVAISEAHSFLFIPGDCFFFSTSAFISLVDLGAITAYRVTNDSTQSIPTIQLKDIFSPGLFLSFGIDKTPLSLNFGYQVGPLLRRIQSSQGSFTNAYSRWSFSICVDIPLVDFYTKPKY